MFLKNICSRTELWSTFYDLSKSYKLEQRLSLGSRQACRNSRSAKRNLCEHKHMFNRFCAHMRNSRSAGRSFGVVKWKLETLKHIFNRRTTGTRTIARLCAVYPVNLSIGLLYKCLPQKVFSLKIFQSTLPSHPNRI